MKMSRFFKSAVVALTLSVSFTMASTSFASDFKSWQTEVVKLVAKKQVYPRAAMRQELEGRAKVKINIDRSDAITSYELVEPSGVEIFDKEIDSLVERLNPLPAPPASASESQLSFILPLTWQIQ